MYIEGVAKISPKRGKKGGISDKKERKNWSKTLWNVSTVTLLLSLLFFFQADCLIYSIHWIMIQWTEPLLRHLLLRFFILTALLQGDDCSWGLYHHLFLQGLEKLQEFYLMPLSTCIPAPFFAFILCYAYVYHSFMPLTSRNASL